MLRNAKLVTESKGQVALRIRAPHSKATPGLVLCP